MDTPHYVRVLIVERDHDLLETLELFLDDMGYAVAATSDPLLAEAALRVTDDPLVLVIGPGCEWEAAAHLLPRVAQLPPHAYLLLSTLPARAPIVWNPHTSRPIPVVPAPFDLDGLLAEIDGAWAAASGIRVPAVEPAIAAAVLV